MFNLIRGWMLGSCVQGILIREPPGVCNKTSLATEAFKENWRRTIELVRLAARHTIPYIVELPTISRCLKEQSSLKLLRMQVPSVHVVDSCSYGTRWKRSSIIFSKNCIFQGRPRCAGNVACCAFSHQPHIALRSKGNQTCTRIGPLGVQLVQSLARCIQEAAEDLRQRRIAQLCKLVN